jgi:sterol desaturase/sphingolipid hydroxylase (fatty acid hydroxylase superfamily)
MFEKYTISLVLIAIVFTLLEFLFPYRIIKKKIKKRIVDFFYQVVNFKLVGGMMEAGVLFFYVYLFQLNTKPSFLSWKNFEEYPVIVVALLFLILIDFIEYIVHNLLHRIPFLWEFHKVHHSIKHLDWWGNMLFHPMEIFFYKFISYLPLLFLCPDMPEQIIFGIAIFRLMVGSFAHSNLNVDLGLLKYIINNPKVHSWHHANDNRAINKNLGVTFTFWDFIFRTGYYPVNESFPNKGLGFLTVEDYQLVWRQILLPFFKCITFKAEKHRSL